MMITAIIAMSGFVCAGVVLLIERVARREEIQAAFDAGYRRGYRRAASYYEKFPPPRNEPEAGEQ